MIVDRSLADVVAAISIRDEKIKHFIELNESDIKSLERGFFTFDTINRIEIKQKELKEKFNVLGYWNVPILNEEWKLGDIFNEGDFQRILKNEKILRDALFVYQTTPDIPPVSFYFEDINSIEKILQDLEDMTEDIKEHYRICGDYECGSDI